MRDNLACQENMSLEAILAKELYCIEYEKVPVLVSEIKEKSKTSKIVDFLTKSIPLKELSHLKRIKSKGNACEVIVGLDDNREQWLTEEVNRFLSDSDLMPMKTKNVPKVMPKTKRQFEESSKLWPISFHPNKYLEKCLNSTLFDSKAKKIIFDIISNVFEMSEREDSGPSMAAIVTDSNHRIITSCISQVKNHPLKHAILVAIDKVAESQRCDEKPTKDYLCTGYDFYLSSEPCLMCAMALVHSRVRRLFFVATDVNRLSNECSDRAITLHKFHLLPKLNHHFEAWKISFE